MDKGNAIPLGSTVRFQGRVFSVVTDRVRLPNGREVDMDIIRHPGSVVLMPMADEDHVILIEQYRYSIDRWIWEMPAGRIEPGEGDAEAVKRECEEEIGLVPHRIEALAQLFPTPGFCDEVMRFYRVSDLKPPAPDSEARRDEDEDLRVHTFLLSEAEEMARDGRIVDMKTAYALSIAARYPFSRSHA
jgi:ADP-ribose diphosphatase